MCYIMTVFLYVRFAGGVGRDDVLLPMVFKVVYICDGGIHENTMPDARVGAMEHETHDDIEPANDGTAASLPKE